jgi:transposase
MAITLAKINSKPLVARIERAVYMVYLDGATEAQISKALGTKSETVRDWKKRPEWDAAVARLQEHQQTLVLDRLALLTEKAADAIEESLESANPTVKLKAAQWLLDRRLEVTGINDDTVGTQPLGEVEKFIKMVSLNVHK